MAVTSFRVQDALATVLLQMANGSNLLPIWLPMSGDVRMRILDAQRRVGIEDTPSMDSSVTPEGIASYAKVSASMNPVP